MRFNFIRDALRHSLPSVAIPALWFSSLNTRSFQTELWMKPPAPLHPTDFMHGVLSAHSYEEGLKGGELTFTDSLTKKYNKYLKDWKTEYIVQDTKSGYHGVIYVNEKTKQVVLAHRGTSLKLEDSIKKDSPLKTDIKGILHDEIVPQQIKAYELTKQAVIYCRTNGYELSITGHSLGAWLAELSGYYCHSDFKDELGDISPVRIVTFDSPGSKKTMEKFAPNIVNKRTQREHDLTDLDIVTYLSRPNLINSCNGHVGEVIGLKVDIDNPEIMRKITSFLDKQPLIGKFLKQKILANKYVLDGILSLSGHSLVLILDQLDPDSGKPREDRAFRVVDWPCLEYQEKEDTTRDLKLYVDKIPKVHPAVKALIKVAIDSGEHTTLVAALSNLRGLAVGIYNADQYWTTYEHIDQDIESFTKAGSESTDKRATERTIDDRREFLLKYQGHYRTEPYNPQKDLLSSEKHHSDYFLDLINRCNSEALGEKFSWWTPTGKQILQIKKLFKIDSHGYISSQDSRITIDEIRNWIRAVEKAYKAEHNGKSLDGILTEADTIQVLEQDSHAKSIARYIPYDRNKKFIEREKEQKAIEEQLHKGQIATITGLAGSGKSSLALEYAHKQKDAGTTVIWFKADSIENFIQEYQQFARRLGSITPSLGEDFLIQQANDRLSGIKKEILFVIDNLENFESIKKYISNIPNNVRVLVTSRDGTKLDGLAENEGSIRVEPFDRDKSVEYLKKNIQKKLTETQLDELYRKISTDAGALPYELSTAVGFINQQLDNGEKNLDKIVQQITTESQYLFKSIDKDGLEWKLIQYLAYLDPDNISIDILQDLLGEDRVKIKLAIAKLEKLSLVNSIHTDEGLQTGLSLHRLTQERTIKYTETKPQEAKAIAESQIMTGLLEYFAKEFPETDYNPNEARDKKCKELLPHVIKLVEPNFDNKDSNLYKANLLVKIGKFYCNRMSENYLGLKYYELELELNRSLYKDDHPSISASLNTIGTVYRIAGEYDKALEKYYMKALEMEHRIFQGDHPNIARTLYNLGKLYYIKGEKDNALKYHLESLGMKKRIYQGDHPDIAESLDNIGSVYFSNGEYDRALEYHLKALEMQQKVYQGDHPDIAESLHQIGYVYKYKGEYDKASGYHENALNMIKRLYIGDHPDVAGCLSRIGSFYHSIEEYDKALEYFEKALEMLKRIHGHQGNYSFSIARCLNDIGYVYDLKGEYDKAIEYLEKALEIKQQNYKEEDTSDAMIDRMEIATFLNSMGAVYRQKGEYGEALKYYYKALVMYNSVFKTSTEEVALLLQSIASVYSSKEDYDEALKYYLESLELQRKIYQGDHPNIAKFLSNVGSVYFKKEDYDTAFKYIHESLEMSKRIYQGDHPAIATSLANLGDAYEKLGDADKSLECKKQSYLIYKKFSDEGKKAKAVKKFLEEKAPEFLASDEARESIIKYGKFDEKSFAVQKQIQASILNKIHKLASKGKWSEETWTSFAAGDWGILGYLDESYLKRQVGENQADLDAARMLVFEAINIGIMSSPKQGKDLTCARKFLEKYPDLKTRIIKEHPEYFVDGLIVRSLCSSEEATELLENKNFDGKGLEDHDDFEDIAPYWQIYSRDAMEKLTKLRIQDTECEDNTKIIVPDFIWDGTENTESKLESYLLAEIHQANQSRTTSSTTNKIILVLNLYGKHWVGLVIDFKEVKESNQLNITYLDPEQNAVPVELESFLQNLAEKTIQRFTLKLTHEVCDKQKYNNCGSEVIESIAYNLTGYRESQEKAIYLHSKLLEMELLLGGVSEMVSSY